jgi:hypothetical protein
MEFPSQQCVCVGGGGRRRDEADKTIKCFIDLFHLSLFNKETVRHKQKEMYSAGCCILRNKPLSYFQII